eukprot:7660605-Alexandrium_andersonii.AAC.1
MHLGAMLSFRRDALWFLLDQNIFGIVGSAGERLPAAALRMRGELMAFYQAWAAQGGAELTQ